MSSYVNFSLRTLFVAVTAVAICLGATMALGRIGGGLSLAGVGLFVVHMGIRKKLPIVAAFGVTLATFGIVLPAVRGPRWIGHITVTVSFTVIDKASRQPIPNASVELRGDATTSHLAAGRTNPAGRVTFPVSFVMSGSDDLFASAASAHVSDVDVKIEAEGYVPFRSSLSDYVDSERAARKGETFVIEIGLDKSS